ncbi:hypothetical protein PENTCL1PPCAC_19144, partial [Pristionchus entomophagus]
SSIMSRPGSWSRVLTNLKKYITKDFSERVYVGKDNLGHRYYEIRNSRQNVSRGFEPPKDAQKTVDYSGPSVEWQSWLKGTRRFPPGDQEIALNRARQQAQLTEDAAREKRAPIVTSTGKGASESTQPRHYPKYEDLEINPGAPLQNDPKKKD